jgi:hypothetical protein
MRNGIQPLDSPCTPTYLNDVFCCFSAEVVKVPSRKLSVRWQDVYQVVWDALSFSQWQLRNKSQTWSNTHVTCYTTLVGMGWLHGAAQVLLQFRLLMDMLHLRLM